MKYIEKILKCVCHHCHKLKIFKVRLSQCRTTTNESSSFVSSRSPTPQKDSAKRPNFLDPFQSAAKSKPTSRRKTRSAIFVALTYPPKFSSENISCMSEIRSMTQGKCSRSFQASLKKTLKCWGSLSQGLST
jgi:hypothetical protein